MNRRVDERLLETVRLRAIEQGGRVSGADVAEAVRASGLVVGSGTATHVIRMLQEELTGLGPLQSLADADGVSDVLVDGDGAVWVEADGVLSRAEYTFASAEDVHRLAVRLLGSGGQRLDEAEPFGDVVVGDYRVHAVLPPVAARGPVLSIRVRRRRRLGLEEVLGAGSGWFELLRTVVDSRRNFLVSGGTGSGKTTLLAAMLGQAGEAERLVVCEDARELEPEHPHVISLQCRNGNVEGAGGVGLADLVRQSLRMRPDRLIVGECRGAEIRDFLAAMNTGHDGAGGTLHASSCEAVPARLCAMGALAGMSGDATALQAAGAIDFLIQMRRPGRGAARRGPQTLAVLELEPNGAGHRMATRIVAHDDGTGPRFEPSAAAHVAALVAAGMPEAVVRWAQDGGPA
ncbi:TadA family conjugal transfer-associated ATPase [Zhihengliuella halotolerans]|uniref:TadA family conjugal transfer-associated ATPase n=1 Tax=Zhihengliuella halotolerans TaxID=370736 RepID=UPI000C7F85EC|nr:TadA family conjugal transfer-associated ATPase [Zhihengliuella halotolerans]